MKEIKQALGTILIGQPMATRNLTVFPLITEQARTPDYLPLPEALRRGVARVTEVSESGHVPRLAFVNKSDLPVLLLDGEELVGCKQNRVLNLTVLAPAHAELEIPVSCVEQGRWRVDSPHFEASGRSMFAEGRAAKVAQVTKCLIEQDAPEADQCAIWEGIAGKSRRLGSESMSGAMSGVYERREAEIEDYLRKVRTSPSQVGAAFSINGRVVGLELFDCTATCEAYLSKIASGYALDAIDHYTTVFESPQSNAVEDFISRVVGSEEHRRPGVGLGESLRLRSARLAGAALANDGRLIHLCAFELAEDTLRNSPRAHGDDSRASAPIRRRRV